MIRYRALGAAGTMGESAHVIEFGRQGVLLDAGCHPRTGAVASFRGAQAAGVRAAVLSHAHLDHAGGLPQMLRGLPGVSVVCTPGTRALAELALSDHLNRARAQAGRGGLPFSEVERVALPWRETPLDTDVELFAGGPRGRLLDAGHLPGAAGVLLEFEGRRVFYTGDTHLADRCWQRGATWPEAPVDVLVMETTQGGNAALDEVSQPALEARLSELLVEVLGGGGQVLLPVFAFGKAQEMAALVIRMRRSGRLPDVPVYLGGLAARVNTLADRHTEARHRCTPDLSLSALDGRPLLPVHADRPPTGPALFMVGSGMLAEGSLAGRMADQLLPNPANALIFVGYLDPDTPGFEVRAGGRSGRARIESLPFSAHARRTDLVAAAVALRPRHIVLIHGDETARTWMAASLAERLPATRIHRPLPGTPVELP